MSSTPVDLTNCDREPILQPGAIQPLGVLLVFRGPELRVTQASQNVKERFGVSALSLVGAQISEVFAVDEAAELEATLHRDVSDAKPRFLFTGRVRDVAEPCDAIAHRSGDLLFVEFEPARDEHGLS